MSFRSSEERKSSQFPKEKYNPSKKEYCVIQGWDIQIFSYDSQKNQLISSFDSRIDAHDSFERIDSLNRFTRNLPIPKNGIT
jgi:hypothetical protein